MRILHIYAYICILSLSYIYCPAAGAREIRGALGSNRGALALPSSVPWWDSIRMTSRMALAPCKNGLKLTKSGRHSIKKNGVNARYSTKYRSPSKQRKLLGKSLSMSKACAIIGTVMFGPEILLEDAGHDDRLRVLKQRRSIASTTKISQISSTQRSPR